MTLQEMSKGHANKNKPNNTEPYETDSFLLSFPEEEIPPLKDERTIPDGTTEGQDRLPGDIYDSYFRRSLKYDHYMQTLEHGRRDMYAQYVELIIDTVRDNSDFVEIGRGRVPYEAVRARFMQLTPDDVLSVMDKISNYSGERIVNMHKYVLTALFREPVISGAAISQQVAFDLYGDDAEVYDGCA